MVILLLALTLPTTIIIIGLQIADILMVKDVTACFLPNNLNCKKNNGFALWVSKRNLFVLALKSRVSLSFATFPIVSRNIRMRPNVRSL